MSEEKRQILIAEDERLSRHLLKSTLEKWNYEVTAVENGAQAWEILRQEQAPDLVVLDWMMPEMDGLEVCRKVREKNSESYTYIILLTAKGHKEDVIHGLESGADDYVSKPFDANELKVRLRAGDRIISLQRQLLAAKEELREQATHDALTHLWNRGATIEKLTKEVERAEREKTYLGIVMADLDFFKKINDTYGHPVGDAVLMEAARRFAVAARPYDVVGRYGGEEFMVLLPGCDVMNTQMHAERLLNALRSSPIIHQTINLNVTGSFGVSSTELFHEISVDKLINSADQALYTAKENGRNSVAIGRGDQGPAGSPRSVKKTQGFAHSIRM